MSKRFFHALVFILFAFLALCLCSTVFGQEAVVNVSPSEVTASINQEFTVAFNISGVTDLYGWEVALTWNSTLLNAVDVTEGSFLKSAGGSTFFTNATDNIDGNMTIDCTLTGSFNGVDGSGTLATVTFLVIASGQCALNLNEVTLVNSGDQQIPCQTSNGYFEYSHDISVMAVEPFKTSVVKNYSMNITVIVENDLTYSVTINTTAYINSTLIGTNLTTLSSGGSIKLVFPWNTGSLYSIYSTSAHVFSVQNETDTASNVGGQVAVTIPGDVNGDFKVNLADLVILAEAYGTNSTNARILGTHQWNPNADIDNNGIVGLSDLVLLATHYGQHYP